MQSANIRYLVLNGQRLNTPKIKLQDGRLCTKFKPHKSMPKKNTTNKLNINKDKNNTNKGKKERRQTFYSYI